VITHVAAGPRASGVYATFRDGGRVLQLLNPRAAVTATLGAGAGLVAATVPSGAAAATWVITGTDPTGVETAAQALDPARLRNVFALALAGGRSLPIPLDPSS
jgi:hypothetical protein